LRTVTLGKVKSDGSNFIYLRQGGTSSLSAFEVDWVHHVLGSRLPQDFAALSARIAGAAAGGDRAAESELALQLREGYAEIMRRLLAGQLMRYRFPRLHALKQAVRRVPRPAMPFRVRRLSERAALWKQLASDGASADTIRGHARELGDIQATLEGPEFARFVSERAPELLQSVRELKAAYA
jgi:hypothetical protein